MKPKITYVTLPNGKRVVRSKTFVGVDGAFLHIDRLIMPISKPRRLGADSPLDSSEQDEKIPIAKAGL